MDEIYSFIKDKIYWLFWINILFIMGEIYLSIMDKICLFIMYEIYWFIMDKIYSFILVLRDSKRIYVFIIDLKCVS